MVSFSYVNNSEDKAAKRVSLENFSDIIGWFDKFKVKSKDGVAIISGNFSEQRRKLQFAEFADIIMFDVDAEGLSFNQALEKLKELKLEAILYTSYSHGTSKAGLTGDRYRIILNLLNPILAQDYKALWLGLESYLTELGFRCDKSCKDITRLMFTPRIKNPEATKEPKIEYIKGFRLEPEFYRVRGAAKLAYKGEFKIDSAVLVTDSIKAKAIQALKFIPPRREGTGTYHETLAVASALKTVFGVNDGYTALELWSPGFKDLNAFADLPSAFTVSTIFFYAKQNGWKDELSVTREVDKRYLTAEDVMSEKSLCVTISPQGTGKTEAISKALESEEKVALLGHRRNLIRQASKRLNLKCYLDEDYTGAKTKHSRVGICIDSILKLKKECLGGVVVIDEWTQVLRHLTGGTLKRKRATVLACFVDVLKAASKIILLDAIADESLLNLLLGFSGKTLENCEITKNNYAEIGANRVVDFKRSKDDLIASVIKACEEQLKFAVATDSKADADAIVEVIRSNYVYPESEGKEVKILLVTSDTSKGSEAHEFINNADKNSENLDVLVYTPAISTGVDIQSLRFTKVFGLFTGVLAAPDIVQSLRRVRNTQTIELHITPAAWTPDISDLEACLVTSGAFLNWPKFELPSSAYEWVTVNSSGKLVYRDEGYVFLLKAIFEHERRFKISLANQVAKMLSYQGFNCESLLLRPTDLERVEARADMDNAKQTVSLNKVKAVMETKGKLDSWTAKTVLQDSTADVETVKAAMITLASEVSNIPEIIEDIVSNELTRHTLTVQASHNIAEVFTTKPDVEYELNERKRQDVDNYKLKFLKFGIYGELLNCLGGIDSEARYEQSKVQELIDIISKYAKPIQWIWKIDLRNIASTRPRATVNKVFKRILGCTFERSQRRVNGAVTSFFRLSRAEAEVIENYLTTISVNPKAVVDFSWVKEANDRALDEAKVKEYDKFGNEVIEESAEPEATMSDTASNSETVMF